MSHQQKRLDLTDSASLLAVDFAARSKNVEQKKEAKRIRDQTMALGKDATLAAQALKTLESSPDDPSANLVLGKWYCFTLNEYGKGRPYLEKCYEQSLVAAARAEIESADNIAIADAWYEAAGKLKGDDMIAAQSRALTSYSAAAAKLTGLEQLRATRREAELKAAVTSVGKAAPALKMPRSGTKKKK